MASIRKSASPPAPHIPEIKVNGVEAEPSAAVSVELPDKAAEYENEIETADEATARLQKQLGDLQKSEELQRQRATAAMQPTPEQVLRFWKNNGLDESGEQFLRTHPQHVLGLTDFASRQAIQQGHQLGSTAHTEAATVIFHDNLARLEAQQAQAAAASALQPTAEFPRPSLAPLPPEPPPQTSHYSAPVSRGEIGNYHREPSPSSVRLTPDELAIASASGISPVEYAKNKLRMLREQASGDRQR